MSTCASDSNRCTLALSPAGLYLNRAVPQQGCTSRGLHLNTAYLNRAVTQQALNRAVPQQGCTSNRALPQQGYTSTGLYFNRAVPQQG